MGLSPAVLSDVGLRLDDGNTVLVVFAIADRGEPQECRRRRAATGDLSLKQQLWFTDSSQLELIRWGGTSRRERDEPLDLSSVTVAVS
jgi:hypothetical protein